MARFFYTVLYALLLPVFVARLWWRGRLNPGYRQRIAERFGLLPHRPAANGLWVHAVSVGETLAAAPYIKAMQSQYPDLPIIVTTTTPTGSEQVKRLFGERVFHMFLPYDLPVFWKPFLNRIQPGLLVVMETELWPNLMAACENKKIPVMLANARLSEKSARGYAKFSALTAPMLQRLNLVAAQNATDGQRFIGLGLPDSKMEVTGSVKFDVDLPADLADKGAALRQQWGADRKVLALASSHANEDEQLLAIYPQLKAACPELLLLLIPRHPERFDAVTQAAKQAGLQVCRRSQSQADDQCEVYIADTMGEMLQLLSAADLVLMGGSLIEHGGHNPIEPAALGKATLTGPHYMNFAAIVDTLVEEQALAVVQPESLCDDVLAFLNDDDKRNAMGEAGLKTVAKNRGAVQRLVEISGNFLFD